MPPNQDVQAVLRSQEYFRLKQVVQSPGDIFELEESTRAIYIGPDSDIGEVEITYYNPLVPLSLETAKVSVNGPFVGRVDSLPKTEVSSTGQMARILVSPVDLVDNNYTSPDSEAQRKYNIPAVIDLMCSLKPLPDIPAVRADRTLRFPRVPFSRAAHAPDDDGSTDLIVPIYGRRMVTITGIGTGLDLRFSLVTLQPGVATKPRLLGLLPIGTNGGGAGFFGTASAIIRASDAARQGTVFQVTEEPISATSSYVESDSPPGIEDIEDIFPQPRGMADLLLINIKNDSNVSTGTSFCDLFIKVADRET